MPNWKKVIVSGSNAILNHITASGNISASGTIEALSYNIGNYNLANINGSELRHGFDSTLTSFMYGKDGTEAHYFNGNVTASGNISASGTITANSFVGALTGNAATATKIASITNTNIVQLTTTQTLSGKTLTLPIIGGGGATFAGSTSGGTKLVATAVAGTTTLTLPAETGTLATVGGEETLAGKTLTSPVINSPTGLVKGDVGLGNVDNTSNATERAAAATLANKTLTAPTITGAGAIAGVFTGNITGNVTGNADTVTTNANLTGPVTSTGNTTAIASGAITTDMQKHLQTFEFNGYSAAPASTNYFIPSLISENKGPFLHNVDAGASGVTALTPAVLSRSGGKVMPYAGTCKLWKGWIGVTGGAAFKVRLFKYTPVPNDATPDSLVLVKEFSSTAAGNNNLIAISEDGFVIDFDAGDILITGISCAVGATAYFTSTLEVEWD
jgi:hypothetical protein